MGAEWELDRSGVVKMQEWTKMRWKQGGKQMRSCRTLDKNRIETLYKDAKIITKNDN